MANQTESGMCPADAAPRNASRAASTPRVVVSSSCDATARVPLPPPLPMKAAMSARERRRYGTYPAALMIPRTAEEPNGCPESV